MYFTTEANEKNRLYSHGQSSSKPGLFSSGILANSGVVGLDRSVQFFTILHSYRFTKYIIFTDYTVRKSHAANQNNLWGAI